METTTSSTRGQIVIPRSTLEDVLGCAEMAAGHSVHGAGESPGRSGKRGGKARL